MANWANLQKIELDVETEMLRTDGHVVNPGARRITHRKLALSAAGGQIYYYIGHEYPNSADSWKHEPFSLEVIVNGGIETSHQEFSRTFSQRPATTETSVNDVMASDIIWYVLPVWWSTQYPSPKDLMTEQQFIIGEAMKSPHYHRNDDRQMIGGEQCFLYESQVANDKLYVSIEKPLCLLRRECVRPPVPSTL